MPAVLVHGVADTFHVFGPVLDHLHRTDVTALALPGFAGPLPGGFSATKEHYLAWLIERIQHFGEPVDLVGHDWGCILTARLASLRPDLVRTWAGSSGPLHPDYDWYPLAKVWQTAGAGEAWMNDLDPASFEQQLAAFGVPASHARQAVARIDNTMKSAILRLYRSAERIGPEWGANLHHVVAPSLLLWGLRDPFVSHEYADWMALETRAHKVVKFDAGHWPLLEKPREFASELSQHWQMAGSQ